VRGRGGGGGGGGGGKERRRGGGINVAVRRQPAAVKMLLLFVRTSAVSLLLFLLFLSGGLEAAGQRGLTCAQEVPAELIRDLWSRNQQLVAELPVGSIPLITDSYCSVRSRYRSIPDQYL